MGVRWFYPGELGEYYPRNPSVQLPGLDSFQSPSLNRSGINLVCASFNVGASLEWLVRNKIDIGAGQGFRVYEDMNAARGDEFFKARAIRPSSRGGHNWFEQAVPGEKYFKTNPEFFVMLDGKRQWTPDGRVQRCFSNPTVQQLCKDYVLKTTLEGREFGFSAEDATGNYCHCPKCIEMGTADGKFTTSNLYHRLFSDIAKYVVERNPKAQLVAAAYSEYRDPPTAKDVSYDPDHVMIDICTHQRCYVHTFDDPSCEPNKGQYQRYLDWMKICPNIKFYDYIDCANSMYAPWEYVMAKDFKRFAENKNAGWVDECPPPYAGYVPALKKMYPLAPEKWFSRWQLYYVMSKLSWDASLDVDQLMADAYDKY